VNSCDSISDDKVREGVIIMQETHLWRQLGSDIKSFMGSSKLIEGANWCSSRKDRPLTSKWMKVFPMRSTTEDANLEVLRAFFLDMGWHWN